ncbi:MAG TPA: signal peptidase I [Patescibacteria group bacterium]
MKHNNLFYQAGCLFRLGSTTLVVIALLALVKHFVFDILPLSGVSMYPTYHDRDTYILNKISYVTGQPHRGDVVVLRFPGDPERARYIKRLIGLPGEHLAIKDGKVFINDELLSESYIADDMITEGFNYPDITLGTDQYYLVGDNRPLSSDSRTWGTASKSDFIGKVFYIVWPFNRARPIPSPVY